MINSFLRRLYCIYKLRRIPKIILEEIIDKQCKKPSCSNCKYYNDKHCKIMHEKVSLNGICDEHVYDACFLLNEYQIYQTNRLKKMIDYRSNDSID